MKKITALILALAISLSSPLFSFARDEKDNENDEFAFVKAKSAVLMNLDTGEMLYGKNERERLSPASVTKVMSILLVLEALDGGKIKLSDKVTASDEAVSMGGSQIWLEKGETMTVDELFKAVVIASANDACVALGEHIAGSVTSFVAMMNERAKQLGCENTNFENCTGLDDTVKKHYSCAYDLALISREVMKHKMIEKYTTIWLSSLRGGKTELNNTNKLINRYNGITGLNTGTTSNAGFCVSATARRGNMNLVAVILGAQTSDDRFDSASGLLDWGFANYKIETAKPDIKKIRAVKVVGGDVKSITPVISGDLKVAVSKKDGKISYNYNIHKKINAPVSKGDSLGHIDIIGEQGLIKSVDLVSPRDVSKTTFLSVFLSLLKTI